jgi:hypothetical protein
MIICLPAGGAFAFFTMRGKIVLDANVCQRLKEIVDEITGCHSVQRVQEHLQVGVCVQVHQLRVFSSCIIPLINSSP